MSSGKVRNARRVNLALESLEDRKLLSTSHASLSVNLPPRCAQASRRPSNKQLAYVTSAGTNVLITLLGPGTLAGSSLNADGSLNIEFSGTTFNSRIQGVATGGTRHAPLATIKDLHTALRRRPNRLATGSRGLE